MTLRPTAATGTHTPAAPGKGESVEAFALAMLKLGVERMRAQGNGDDPDFIEAGFNMAVRRLPGAWRKLTGR